MLVMDGLINRAPITYGAVVHGGCVVMCGRGQRGREPCPTIDPFPKKYPIAPMW